MKKNALLCRLMMTAVLCHGGVAWAQKADALHVVKARVNAESENAELCLEFDATLAPIADLAASVRLDRDGKNVSAQNTVLRGTSLCFLPLERDATYRLTLSGLQGAGHEKMDSPYSQSFTIPNRSPLLAFTGKERDLNGFASYENTLMLRAVNVARAKIDVYHVTDIATMARVWQERAQTSIAPTESAYLARSKGQKAWQGETVFRGAANSTTEQAFSLRDKMPDLAPGLYLMIADAETAESKPATGLTPLAASWFVKSDFSIRAMRDESGIQIFATQNAGMQPKGDLRLVAVNNRFESLAEYQGRADGVTLMPLPAGLAEGNDVAAVIAMDKIGNVAFADRETLPSLAFHPSLGSLRLDRSLVTPGDVVDVLLSAPETSAFPASPSILRVMRDESAYTDLTVPPLVKENARLSVTAPPVQGLWTLRWQKTDGSLLAQTSMSVTENPDAPHLAIRSTRDVLTGDGALDVSIKSTSASGAPAPLTAGRLTLTWQKLDPAIFGWKDYQFGLPGLLSTPHPVADFLTDMQGEAHLQVTLPPLPQERGLYQVELKTTADADAGIGETPALILPLHPEATVIGVKPLAAEARFSQNGIARFALIGLSSEGKPRDVSGLSYQVYEEGRSFAWYQDEGRWQYKPEPSLRPIGGGALAIKADTSTILEWPVTAGNYRLEIFDSNSKPLAQTSFSAGWEKSAAETLALPLNVSLPQTLSSGREAAAHVLLPEPALLTGVIADTRIRKTILAVYPKGDVVLPFTPAADWRNGVSVSVEAIAEDGQHRVGYALADIAAPQVKSNTPETANAAPLIIATDTPAGLVLSKGDRATLTFGIANKGEGAETYHYSFSASPGLKIESGASGNLTLRGNQSKSLALSVSGDSVGGKELRMEVTGTHAPRQNRVWTLAVLPKDRALHSTQAMQIRPQKALLPPRNSAAGEEGVMLISRHSLTGVPELLSTLFNAQPLTTREVASSVQALRLWDDVLAQTGIAPGFLVTARRQEQLALLVRAQNRDGGFSALPGGDSTLEDTAAALTALAVESSEVFKPARQLAIAWSKQQIANDWFTEKERAPRAAVYAALGAADALDPASLHYFSDTSAAGARESLSPIAKAQIAAAFKHIRDPDAAAFWIHKMLTEDGALHAPALLKALAETDALSSDAVQEALSDGAQRRDIKAVADLLIALAADQVNAGKWRLVTDHETRDVSGVVVLRAGDPAAASYRNGDDHPLFVTPVTEVPKSAMRQTEEPSLTRHVYRLNGVEVAAGTKPARGDVYLVEIKGTLPSSTGHERWILQDGGSGLRPVGCPLSYRLETLPFLPWLTTQSLTPIEACAFSFHTLSAALAPVPDEDRFSLIYFAHIDAPTIEALPTPILRQGE